MCNQDVKKGTGFVCMLFWCLGGLNIGKKLIRSKLRASLVQFFLQAIWFIHLQLPPMQKAAPTAQEFQGFIITRQ